MRRRVHTAANQCSMASPRHTQVQVEYVGCKLGDPGFQIQTVLVNHLEPLKFWRDFISQRKPVLIKGHPLEADWRASGLWTNDYLDKHAGAMEVWVEVRERAQDTYGKGRKVKMTFGEFLKQLKAGGTNLYMSTQPCGKDADGFPKLIAPPASGLQQDFPLRPQLMGHLVPQQINMWMGAAAEGSTSGLHHDFHDNLYVLLKGSKRFILYDPSQAPDMYTVGQVKRIHPNGRIVYHGQGEVTADGLEQQEVQWWEKVRAAEAQIESARTEVQAAGEKSHGKSKEKLAEAEQALEDLLEAALDDAGLDMDEFDDEFDDEFEDQQEGGNGGSLEPDPPSFSQVDLRQDDASLLRKWPRFPSKAAATVVHMEAGDMLYMPAGWFHEVTSFGSPDQGGHLALNYWFYPPSNLDPTPQGFAKPYTSDFLPNLWKDRTAPRGSNGCSSKRNSNGLSAAEVELCGKPSGKGRGAAAMYNWVDADLSQNPSKQGNKKKKKKRRMVEEKQDDTAQSPLLADCSKTLSTSGWHAAAQLMVALFGQKKKKRAKPVWWWKGRRHHVAVCVPRSKQ